MCKRCWTAMAVVVGLHYAAGCGSQLQQSVPPPPSSAAAGQVDNSSGVPVSSPERGGGESAGPSGNSTQPPEAVGALQTGSDAASGPAGMAGSAGAGGPAGPNEAAGTGAAAGKTGKTGAGGSTEPGSQGASSPGGTPADEPDQPANDEPAGPAAQEGNAASTDALPGSPVRVYARMGRMGPEWNYSAEDFAVMAEKFDVIVGLDGHGYNFPGAIDTFRELNTQTPVLTMWNTMSMQLVGESFSAMDVEESVFIHSGDPASLRVLTLNSRTIGLFRQDARVLEFGQYYEPAGVTEYVVEYAASPNGPFTPLGNPIAEDGAPYHSFADLRVAGRHYRVRSRLGSGQLVDYSWAASPMPETAAALAAVRVQPDGEMTALCYGSGCPASPQGVRLERDLDYDHVLGESECGDSGCERWPFSSVQVQPDGGRRYTGTLPLPAPWPFSYRAVLAAAPSVRCPIEGSYQRRGYNNRIEMQQFGSLLVWPDHPLWRQFVVQRLQSALAHGYNGMRLDFMYDNIDWFWIASGVPPEWSGPQDTRIADGVAALLGELRAAAPGAIIMFNGYFLPRERSNYYRYLSAASGAEFEFFAYGLHEGATTYDERTEDAMSGVWITQRLGRWAVAVAGRHEEDITARMQSLMMYLLVVDDGVFMCFETCCNSQDLAYFPEWDVPLGEPLARVLEPEELADPRGDYLLSRSFQNGEVLFNFDDGPVTLNLPSAHYKLSVTGGKSPLVGGDGAAHYSPVQSLTLAPRSGVILVRTAPATP